MGESSMVSIAEALKTGRSAAELKNLRGTVCAVSSKDQLPPDCLILPSFEEVSADRRAYAESFRIQYHNTDPVLAKPLAEPCGKRFVLQNPPSFPITREAMDRVYALPYMRKAHPMYDSEGGIPALKEVEFSLEHNRGVFRQLQLLRHYISSGEDCLFPEPQFRTGRS